jgi:pyruvate,orthophosphate dikinase
VHLAVRHVSDPAEAAALRTLRDRTDGRGPMVGSYLTSPRGVFHVAEIAAASDVLWLEVRALQAAMFGIPARQLLTAEPLDGYVRRGLLGTDPRSAVDPSVDPLLGAVAAASTDLAECQVGMRLSGEVTAAVATRLYGLGLRRFAVDASETRPLLLALGNAALSA